jgi:putative membrane protein
MCSSVSRVMLVLALTALPLVAHKGEPLQPHDFWTAWSWDPLILVGLVLSAVLYWRGDRPGHGIQQWERISYWIGWISLVIALVSPLHPTGEVLFSAHMVQHEMLMLIAAPLIVLGRPLVAYMWGMPESWRKPVGSIGKIAWLGSFWRWLTRPWNAWWIHAVALWCWHAPRLFEATLTSDTVHALQHLSFLVTALLFWWALLRGREGYLGYGAGVFYVFTTGVHSSILGALLTFSTTPWYSGYARTTQAWGLTPLEDQQLGGLVMWVPAGLVFLAAGLVLFAKWMQSSDSPARLGQTLVVVCALLGLSCTPELQYDNPGRVAYQITGGDADRGKYAIARYGCGSCHTIPGIRAASGLVGSPLNRIASQTYIAGVLTNTPEHMSRWIKDPLSVDSLTAMPNLAVTDGEIVDIVAYLYTLR